MCDIKLCSVLFGLYLTCHGEVSTLPINEAHNNTTGTRIVGGQVVEDRSRFAFQVSLRRDGRPSCGASLIDDRNLLTAAHCVTHGRNVIAVHRFRAFIGDLHTDRLSPTTITRWIRRIFVHEQYNHITLLSDIAVLRIDPVTIGININSIPLALVLPNVNTLCTVSGWGLMHYGGIPSNILRFVHVPMISEAECRASYGNSLLADMICAGYYGRDACEGDSGGPLICNGSQVGVVSWGVGCGFQDFPGVYASVPYYRTWILQQQERSSTKRNAYKLEILYGIIVINVLTISIKLFT